MKKTILLFTLTLMGYVGTLHAQDTKRIGGQLIYGSNIESLGIGAIAELPVAAKMVISPSFSFYFPKDQGFFKQSAWELNGNLNYLFVEEEKLTFYGLGGLNYTSINVSSNMAGVGNFSSSAGRIGLNIGAGANFEIGMSFLPFAEIKYILGDFDRLVIGAGVKFNL
ncbi:porin family protein [Belliella kenyensis]|uniref:Porin family protein n=1 Tax=Belliella kenyensis TaxID=1472724 RepID=A0ABV8EMR8_9BACT|nr:porin family protein [Belliella kenyensis]MCH7400799.1 porin family protein [Belliella kenyensis]MDN3601913.1 porin family protein [Belliella kenyensis]